MLPTEAPPPRSARAEPRTPSRHPSNPATPHSSGYGEAGFAPGQLFAERYRIIGLLGAGGMGEVYRADDLKLGHPVALKFLSRKLAQNESLVQRFYSEVRLARQVSHPNVCRVYDVGEYDGLLYLSMEYVDGEDLASLLKRIGRLPPDKALDIARELCAGLAAAHDRGVIHRDLKPANVMLDGRGHARITDFGLAIPLDDAAERGFAGTPAYMSPEQLTQGDITHKSDIYSLGLILYEIFTGKRAFDAKSVAERVRTLGSTRPESVTGIAGTEPAVERAILRCLEKDPARRPASALAVAMALPGGDPLAAALAAGETPSPEMVAAAGGEEAVPLRTAWMLLGSVAILLVGIIAIAPYSTDMGLARAEKSPSTLRDRAREIVQRFGYEKEPADSITWIWRDYEPLRYIATHMQAPGWRKLYRELGPPLLFGYRQSPRLLVSEGGATSAEDPPLDVSGMVNVLTDADGRLRAFYAVPPQIEPENLAPPAPFDWPALFSEAGLEPARFQSVEPKWIPAVPFDARAEWSGTRPELPDLTLTVTAAAFRGKLVHFEIRGPWSVPERMQVARRSLGIYIASITLIILIVGVLVAGIFFARRNLRQGRGDRKGAFRLSAFVFVLFLAQWFISMHWMNDLLAMVGDYGRVVAVALMSSVGLWLVYIAVEPYLRRRIPELLIGWARLLEGRWRDPRVGRDILLGSIAGGAFALTFHTINALPTWFAFQGQTTIPNLSVISIGTNPLAYLLFVPIQAVARALTLLGAYFALRVILRKPALAAAGLGIISLLLGLGGENVKLELPAAVFTALVIVWVITRIGLLAAVAMWFFALMPTGVGPSFDFSSWYASYTMPALVALVGLSVYAFYIAIGSQPIFGAASLED